MRSAVLITLLISIASAQQPNGSLASMTIDGASGPPYPIAKTVPTGVTASFALSGIPGSPFLIAASATGVVQPGALATGGGLVDLPLSPAPVIVIDGAANPAFSLDPTGAFAFGVQVPPAGQIPIGHQEAVQAAIADPTSPAGFTLTAATQVTVVQGPIVVNLALGDDGAALIDVGAHGFSIPFFGTSYGQIWICVNGFLTFGLPDTDFTPTPLELNTGYPRLAPFWTDLEQGAGLVRYTIDPNPAGSQAPSILAEWINVPDWGGQGFTHTFSAFADAAGACRISYPILTSASIFPALCGLAPGNGLNPQPMKDLTALLASGGVTGASYESFYEWFGLASMQGYPGPDRPFDLFGTTLHFTPAGPGALPASTAAYLFN
jgi:hypothetical protein